MVVIDEAYWPMPVINELKLSRRIAGLLSPVVKMVRQNMFAETVAFGGSMYIV